ncbi:hypothetical protein PsorP6_011893 [Peronosclerospora sorghi]|uniref:Uncharacterized protein n=1 Tax=Peronosclerospora sorghi TaxID=230839 RepID=A0ACC0WL94_9STRA|nr:hypothetical protein PsorP6_011893 [Peronosclerospora sorghi]
MPDDEEGKQNESEDREELDREMGDFDQNDENVVDEKLWVKLNKFNGRWRTKGVGIMQGNKIVHIAPKAKTNDKVTKNKIPTEVLDDEKCRAHLCLECSNLPNRTDAAIFSA